MPKPLTAEERKEPPPAEPDRFTGGGRRETPKPDYPGRPGVQNARLDRLESVLRRLMVHLLKQHRQYAPGYADPYLADLIKELSDE